MSEAAPLQITRRTALKWGALAAAAPALSQFSRLDVIADDRESVVITWNKAALQGVRDSKIGPPMVARALAIVHTCIFDAWAAYDDRALGTRLGGSLRRPRRERTLANMNMAISFAAYRAAVDLFPGSKAYLDGRLRMLGYDPDDGTTDATTPVGVGKLAAGAVLEFRHHDGANQLGDDPGGKPGVAYSDYTGYVSKNTAMDLRNYPTCALPTRPGFDPTTVSDPSRWQPLRYLDKSLKDFTQPFVGAQWSAPDGRHVTPFALTSPAQLRSPTGPARYGSDAYVSQAQAVLGLSAGLTDEHKMIAEYWADGPNSELPPGHWDLFAQFVSQRDHHGANKRGVAADVKLFFALTNAIFDASICCWDNKRAYDGVRPITAIRYLAATDQRFQRVRAWGGPCQGTQLIPGEEWLPYQPSYFPTPPFPGYSSGHSTFSAAGAEILRLFTGSDRFEDQVTFKVGSSKTEPGTVPATTITLRWATFSDAAAQAGISRRYGGIHFEQDDLDARAAGRLVARNAWTKAQSYINGSGDNDENDDDN
jgi:PAP2 superfamily